jgi:hypothetical protein
MVGAVYLVALGDKQMPCTMVCLTPVIIAAWPSIVSCVVGAAAALGFTAVSSVNEAKVKTETGAETETVEIELKGSSVLEGYKGEEQFVKDGVTLTIKMNEGGRVVLCAKGKESQKALRQKAITFAEKLQQAYSYHKAMTQLRTTGFKVVYENVEQNEEIHVTLRRF